MYILLKDNVVKEHIPDINPAFPTVPIEERYSAAFLENTIHVDDSLDIPEGYVYDPETGEFSEPPEPEYVEPAEFEEEPTQLDLLEAQVTYTAMMTDTLLGG